jgi:hypothetical protein
MKIYISTIVIVILSLKSQVAIGENKALNFYNQMETSCELFSDNDDFGNSCKKEVQEFFTYMTDSKDSHTIDCLIKNKNVIDFNSCLKFEQDAFSQLQYKSNIKKSELLDKFNLYRNQVVNYCSKRYENTLKAAKCSVNESLEFGSVHYQMGNLTTKHCATINENYRKFIKCRDKIDEEIFEKTNAKKLLSKYNIITERLSKIYSLKILSYSEVIFQSCVKNFSTTINVAECAIERTLILSREIENFTLRSFICSNKNNSYDLYIKCKNN